MVLEKGKQIKVLDQKDCAVIAQWRANYHISFVVTITSRHPENISNTCLDNIALTSIVAKQYFEPCNYPEKIYTSAVSEVKYREETPSYSACQRKCRAHPQCFIYEWGICNDCFYSYGGLAGEDFPQTPVGFSAGRAEVEAWFPRVCYFFYSHNPVYHCSSVTRIYLVSHTLGGH